jgi:hypothetical protein
MLVRRRGLTPSASIDTCDQVSSVEERSVAHDALDTRVGPAFVLAANSTRPHPKTSEGDFAACTANSEVRSSSLSSMPRTPPTTIH